MNFQAELAAVVSSYTQAHLICGVSYCVSVNRRRLATGTSGNTRWEAGKPVRADTAFDLASLTKVMITLPAILQLHASGRLDLHDPIGR